MAPLNALSVNCGRNCFIESDPQFRFKTNRENGILLYSRGSLGDYLALQLVENRLLLSVSLGGKQVRIPLQALLQKIVFARSCFTRDEKVFVNAPTNNKGNHIFTLNLNNMFQP
jgi:hypothetical protein